jgi:hypothetical protein
LANQSHASGLGTRATVTAQTVIGKYNKEDNKALFVVGVGTGDADANRANAFTVGNDGTDDYITVGEEKLTESELKSIKDGFGDIEQALDAILAIQKELLPPPPIEFYIDNVKYTALEGMTWAAWCDSKYNIDGWQVFSDSIQLYLKVVAYPNGEIVPPIDVIVANTAYHGK